jgi:hypothetical protein
MAGVNLKTTINAAADTVWQTVRDFNGLGAYVAAVANSSVDGSEVGCTRTLTLQDGAIIVEKLERFDDQGKALDYSIVSGPLPVEQYLSTIAVTAVGPNQCEVSWSSTFAPKGVSAEQAEEVISGIYTMGFDGLRKLFA